MIEVGEYIRTPYHKIEKIKKIKQEDAWICVTTDKNAYELEWLKTNKVKHSKNIIDLIEVGDYVNGAIVYEILEDKRIHILTGYLLEKKDIKTVLTKEQYQANCYTVEREEEC